MPELPILIAGGGIAGLACALALQPRPAIVLERSAVFEELGAGLQLGPNAVRALRAIGAWEAVEPFTSAPPAIDIHDGVSGKRLKRVELGPAFERRFGAPYRVIHRADLHRALLDCARHHSGISILNNAEVVRWQDSGGVISVALASGQVLKGTSLIGCDGVHSMLRQRAFPGTAPVESDFTLHRAMVDMPQSVKRVAFDAVNLWLCPGAHVVHYPVGRNARLNIVATVHNSVSPEQAHANSCETLQELVRGVPAWLPWPGLYVKPLAEWTMGNMILLGDAAHATLPFLAQGAAMALEDAVALNTAIKLPRNSREREVSFATRRDRTARLHRETISVGSIYHETGIKRSSRNLILSWIPETVFWRRMSWIYNG